MATQPVPAPVFGSPFSDDDSKSAVWPEFFAQQRRWFELHLSFGEELMSVTGPSDYWDWLIKHSEIIPESIDRDPLTHRPISLAARPPQTYNPEWVGQEVDRSNDVEFIKRLHSRMLEQSIAAFVIKQSDAELAVKLVEFWSQHLSVAIGNASKVLEEHVSDWRERWLETIARRAKKRWPITTWATNNSFPEFWRTIRADFEVLGGGDYRLIWTSVPPRALTGELLESHFSWCRSPDEGSRARFGAIAKRAANALGHSSDDGWYEELRKADFVRFALSGSEHQKDETGAMVMVRSGAINDVLKHSITLTFLLEADSEAKHLTPTHSQPTDPERSPLERGPDQTVTIERGVHVGINMGLPHVVQQVFFRESRHSLHAHGLDAEETEALRAEFGQLAHAAIFAVTRDTSVPMGQVDDWIEELEREGSPYDDDLPKLLIASRDYLVARANNELGLGRLKRARQYRQLAAQFAKLHSRFFKAANGSGLSAAGTVAHGGTSPGGSTSQANAVKLATGTSETGEELHDGLSGNFGAMGGVGPDPELGSAGSPVGTSRSEKPDGDTARWASDRAANASRANAQSRSAARKLAKRCKARSMWLDSQRHLKGWTSDVDVASNGGPSYNTIRRYRSGERSTRDPYVRGKLAMTFGCEISEVPD